MGREVAMKAITELPYNGGGKTVLRTITNRNRCGVDGEIVTIIVEIQQTYGRFVPLNLKSYFN